MQRRCAWLVVVCAVIAGVVWGSLSIAGASTPTDIHAPQQPRTFFTVSGRERTIAPKVWAAHERSVASARAWARRLHLLANPRPARGRRKHNVAHGGPKRAQMARAATPAGSMGQALILGSTVTPGLATDGSGTSVEQQEATAAGFSVTVATDAQWAAMSTADFRAYRVLIIGDPDCGDSADTATEAEQSASTWEPAVMDSGGNKVLIGTDPVYHYTGGSAPNGNVLIQNGIAYAGSAPGATGVYLDLSCTYNGAGAGTPVPILDGLSTHGSGQFTVVGTGPLNACGTSVNIVANTGPTTGLSDSDLSDWGCSVHEAFDKFPTDYTPLSIAPSSSGFPTSFCGTDVDTRDTACGSPYILISGAGIVAGGATAAEQGGATPLSEHSTTCSTAQPVNCATGTFWHTFQDVQVPGNGVPLDFSRTYSSADAGTDGPLGYGWTDSYNMTLSLDGSGDVTITDANGSQVSFAPNGAGGFVAPPRVLASLVANGDGTYTFTPYSTHVQYVFDAGGQLEQEVDRNGYTTTLSYNGNQLSTVTDAAGRSLTFSYSANHISSVTGPDGTTWSYSYDGSGNLASASDPMGRTWSFTYDPNHLLLTMTDPRGGTTANTYDSSNRVTEQVDPAGRTTSWAYSGDPASSTGSTTTITDPNGNQTVEKYENLQLLSITKGAGTAQAATTSYQYDPNTLGVSQIIDPNGNTTSNTYDNHGNLLTTTDSLGNTTTYTYNSFDEVASKTDPLGTVTTYSYDASGNLLSKSTALAAGGNSTWSYTYGTGATAGDVVSATNPDGKVTSYGYDGAGDQTSVTDPLGKQTTATYDTDGRLLTETTPNGNTTTYVYDADGELTKVTDALGQTTSYGYDGDGNQISVTDANGHETSYTYDADGEQTAVTSPDGTTDQTAYDNDGNVSTQTDGNDHRRSYTYDALDRVLTSTDPDGATTTYGYDAAGNLLTTADPDGRTTTYTYDADNRVTGISYSDGTTPGVTESYDADGERTSLTDGTGITTFTYDSLGDETSQTNGAGATIEYGYDPAGNPTTITYPNGETVTRSYNDDGQLKSVADWLGNTTSFAYDGDGDLTSEQLPGSVTMASTYDAADRLTGITDTRGATTLASFSYTHDALGEPSGTSASGAVAGSDSYSYDGEDRLTGDNGAVYAYDRAGDPTTFGSDTQTFDPAGEVIASTPSAGENSGSGGGGGSVSATSGPPATPAVPPAAAPPSGQAAQPPRKVAVDGSAVTRKLANSQTLMARLSTHHAGDLVVAFVSAEGSARSVQAAGKPTGAGLAFSIVTRRSSVGETVSVWQAEARRRVSGGSVSVRLAESSTQALLGLVAFAPGARVATRTGADGASGPAHVKLSAVAGSQVWAVGHEENSASGRAPLSGETIVAQIRSAIGHDASWLETENRTSNGVASIGDRRPASGKWAVAAVEIAPSEGGYASALATRALLTGDEGDGARSFTYNGEGDRTGVTSNGATVTLSYDQANELTGVGDDIDYTYDGDGLRASKTVDGATTQFAWDEAGSLPLLIQDGGTYYIYGPSGIPIEQINNGNATYLLADGQGSTRVLTDGSGEVVGTYDYDAWGATTSHTGAATDLQYNGQYTDLESGYQYLRARYYDPSTGQFLTVDQASFLTRSPETYANDAPTTFQDPSGRLDVSGCAILICVTYDSTNGVQVGPGTSRTPGFEIGEGNWGVGTPGVGGSATANGKTMTESVGFCIIICYSRSATQVSNTPAPQINCLATNPTVQDLEYCSADDPTYESDILAALERQDATYKQELATETPGSSAYEETESCYNQTQELLKQIVLGAYEH